ncbi:MAG: phosphatidylglycerophosphatase A [Desulfarculus sp.]|nr:MAG: phosphatidylglycerophosphatase A [Desulfarculus sp.]
MRVLLKWLLSLGVGLLPGPRGTYASLLVAGLAAAWLAAGGGPLVGWPYLVLLLLVCGLTLLAGRAALNRQIFGPSPDPGQIVLDEAAGMLAALYGLNGLGWPILAALVLFRLLDILKPFPVGRLQRLPGAWGVLADDLAAGLLALAGWRLLAYLLS